MKNLLITLLITLFFNLILSQSPHCPISITATNQNNPGELDIFLYNADGDLVGQSTCMRAGGSQNYNCNTILNQLRDDNPDEVVFLSFGNLNNQNDLGSCVYNLNGELMPSTLLPIELYSFDVSIKDKDVYINWVTLSEINNDYFEIERSFDGFNWKSIVTIDGVGNSRIKQEYKHIDREVKYGLIYYRLKQVDFDGEFEIFDIKSILLKERKILVIYNMMGQIVDINYSGIKIIHYDNGDIIKIY